jgi:hypothetical protein
MVPIYDSISTHEIELPGSGSNSTHFFAAFLAAAAHLLNPSFFQPPAFFLYLGANRLNAAPYLLEAAEAFLLGLMALTFLEAIPRNIESA